MKSETVYRMRNVIRRGLLALWLCAAVAVFTGCKDKNHTGRDEMAGGSNQSSESEYHTEAAVNAAGKAEAGSVRPEDNYYDYVNHEFLENVQIPKDSGGWSYFYELDQTVYKHLNEILMKIVGQKGRLVQGTAEQKAEDLYLTAIDVEGRKRAGFGALQSYLDEIRNAGGIPEYMEAIAHVSRDLGCSSLIAPAYYENMGDTDHYGCYLNGADLGPGKETLEDKSQSELLEKYKKYIKSIMQFSGLDEAEAEKSASRIVTFQTDLSAHTLPLSEQNKPEITYNPYTAEQLKNLYSNADVMTFIKEAGAGGFENWIVTEKEQAKKINGYLTKRNLPLLKDYSVFCLIKDFSLYLTPEIRDAGIAWSNTLKGIQEKKSDEKLAGELVQKTLGFEFGRMYAEKYFSEEDKQAVERMVRQIMDAYEERINSLDWMSRETKERAVRKLDNMTLKIGYPDEWPDYYKDAVILPTDKGSFIDNMISVYRAARDCEASRIKGKTDRTQWGMTPQTVNAYYNPLNNEIVFPAAILQPPFYDADAGYASNLGGIGMVIAHEISHAFDSSGALYDENGNYNMWWTAEDMKRFKELTKRVETYYNGQEATSGRYVNGSQTLNENIADLGALACITSLAGDNKGDLKQLFKQYARIWASKYTQESMIQRLNTDVHSPAKVRVNAVLSSTKAFYEAYPDLKEGAGMYVAPEKRVKIW